METKIAFDYQLVHSVYESLFDERVFQVISGVKLLCICLLLMHFYIKFFASTTHKDKASLLNPLSPWDIFKGIGILLAVVSYDYLLMGLDSILAAIEGEYRSFASTPKLGVLDDMSVDALTEDKPGNWTASVISIAAKIGDVLQNPASLVLKLVETIAAFLDLVMYAVFLTERFFFLGVLRVLGALAIACSVIEKLEKWFWSWLSTYTVFWLLAIPLMLANLFTNRLYENLSLAFPDSIPGMMGVGSMVRIIVVFFIVWVKLRVYRKSQELLFKVFS